MSRFASCYCEPSRFTCGHCLRNMPAAHFTPSTAAEIMQEQIANRGWHVETYGGGVWTSIAWLPYAADAQALRTKLIMSGRYAGNQPRVTPGR